MNYLQLGSISPSWLECTDSKDYLMQFTGNGRVHQMAVCVKGQPGNLEYIESGTPVIWLTSLLEVFAVIDGNFKIFVRDELTPDEFSEVAALLRLDSEKQTFAGMPFTAYFAPDNWPCGVQEAAGEKIYELVTASSSLFFTPSKDREIRHRTLQRDLSFLFRALSRAGYLPTSAYHLAGYLKARGGPETLDVSEKGRVAHLGEHIITIQIADGCAFDLYDYCVVANGKEIREGHLPLFVLKLVEAGVLAEKN